MLKKSIVTSIGLALAIWLAVTALRSAANPQKSSVPKQQGNLALGEDEVRRLVLLIAPNERGKITKQEWMKFMEAEFDRLDKDNSGELDAEELARSRVRVSPFAKSGK